MDSFNNQIGYSKTHRPCVEVYINRDKKVDIINYDAIKSIADRDKIFWIDLINPSEEHLNFLGEFFGMDFEMLKDRNEIEHSSRYWEEDGIIEINTNFFTTFFFNKARNESYSETVSFFVNSGVLLTIRYKGLKTFDEVKRRILGRVDDFTKTNYGILGLIFEVRTDFDADNMEYIAREINKLRQDILLIKNLEEGFLEKIDSCQQFILYERVTILDRRKTFIALLKSSLLPARLKEDLDVMIKDINSIVDFGTTNLSTLDNIQNLLLTKISIEQNNVIKIFTIVNVIFLPPTLVASIYGMNFEFLPELKWQYGYYYSIGLMIISAILPVYIFKKKGWV